VQHRCNILHHKRLLQGFNDYFFIIGKSNNSSKTTMKFENQTGLKQVNYCIQVCTINQFLYVNVELYSHKDHLTLLITVSSPFCTAINIALSLRE